jgi:hypothetical protein
MFMSLRHLGWLTFGGFIAWAISRGDGLWWVAPGYAVFVLISWVVSCRRNRTRPCWRCRGKGRHRGWFWDYSTRPCERCGASGRRPRLGTRLFGFDV